ncbi:MAG: FecR domain-containing protein [Candidatus Omnitrophota bacterium]
MKKTLASYLAFFLILSAPAVFAQMPVPVTAPLGVPAGMEQIGVVAAARGKVELTMPGQVGRMAQSGQPVFMGDQINTDEQGNLQILLLDETVFTIGPNSTLVIDEFVYDPKTQDGKVQASIAKGVFRYVSGKIAAKKPSNVTLKLPTATIGIRGTIVGGHVVLGGPSLAALLGPGANNNAGAQPGSFSITGTGQNSGQQNVNHTGFGVTIGANGSVSGVFQLSQTQIIGLTAGLAPSGGGSSSGQGGGSATNQSGQGTILTGENSNTAQGLNGLTDANNATSTTAAQDAAASAEDTGSVADGITQIAQLSRITTGEYHYAGTGAFVQTVTDGSSSTPHIGTVSTSVDINFGTKTIGGGRSFINIDTYKAGGNIQSGFVEIRPVSFNSTGSTYAVFSPAIGSGVPYPSNINAVITLQNANGMVAQNAVCSIAYNNNGSGSYANQGSGSTFGTQSPGLTETPIPPTNSIVSGQ